MTEVESTPAAVPPEDTPAGNLLRYFRDCPDRIFAYLGAFVFVAGWAGTIYLAFFSNFGASNNIAIAYRIQVLVTLGASVTTAAAVLWAVAAYLWIHLLPDDSDRQRPTR